MTPLGDRIEIALKAVGITSEAVERWVGAPCGCPERRDRLNQLDLWARRVVAGRIDRAREWLTRIVGNGV